MIALQGQIKQVQGLKGKLSKPTGERSDHKTIDLAYAYSFTKISSKITTIEYESEEAE